MKQQDEYEAKRTWKDNQREHACDIMERLGLPMSIVSKYHVIGNYPYYVSGSLVGQGLHSAELRETVREFEARTGNLVYAVTYDVMSFGRTLNLLYVSKYEEDWEQDIYGKGAEHRIYEHCINLDREELSESGGIIVLTTNGMLRRVG